MVRCDAVTFAKDVRCESARHAGLAAAACRRIWSLLTSGQERREQKSLGAAGAPEAVASAMRAHAADVEVQKEGCYALFCLTRDHADNTAATRAAGGAEAVRTAMKNHAGNRTVQCYGTGVLERM